MKKKLAIIALIFFLFASSLHAQWVLMARPLSTGNHNEGGVDFFLVNGFSIYAGGHYGLYRSDDNGKNWDTVGLRNVWVQSLLVSDSILIAGNNINGLLRSSDFGKTWFPTGQITGDSIVSVITLTRLGKVFFAGGPVTGRSLHRSTDNGITWSAVDTENLSKKEITSLSVIGNTLFAGTYNSGLYISKDSGLTWSNPNPEFNQPFWKIVETQSNLYASDLGGIFRSSNNGVTWDTIYSPQTVFYYVPEITDSKVGLLAGTYSGVFRSQHYNRVWEDINSSILDQDIIYALADDGKYLYAGNSIGEIWRRPLSDFGVSKVINPLLSDLNLSFSPNPTSGIIVVHNAPENIFHVTVTNILGESVIDLVHPNAPEFTLDLSKLPPGTYFARFSLANEVITRKIIKE